MPKEPSTDMPDIPLPRKIKLATLVKIGGAAISFIAVGAWGAVGWARADRAAALVRLDTLELTTRSTTQEVDALKKSLERLDGKVDQILYYMAGRPTTRPYERGAP